MATLSGMWTMNFRQASPRLRRLAGLACATAALTLVAACGDDDTTATDTTATDTAASAAIQFSGQWARTSPAMATMGAAYVTITSPVDDKLVAASVDSSVAATVEIHETVMGEVGSDTTMGMGGGEMTMRPVEFVELPAGTAVELKPGGLHIMLINLPQPLEVGTTLKITLRFETAGEISLDVPVLDEAP